MLYKKKGKGSNGCHEFFDFISIFKMFIKIVLCNMSNECRVYVGDTCG